ncbi:MAG TPA: biotin--[acetyl-CoA-carboxylase] ligase [Polyangiaceae bacterium]|jgi:BirA family biotin operon repressor/biotin-[acetyl-CoA-carboxylase] ligase
MTPSRVAPDLERAPELVAASGSALGRPMHLLASTPSTNDEAKHAAKKGAPHGSTWVAELQTDGRGRQGRTWISPRGENLLFSVLLRVTCAPSRLPPIALAAGLAVRDAVARAAPDAGVVMKWPNDVLVGERKLAGVLVEAITAGSRVEAVVVGVGINVLTREFPGELAGTAISVARVSSTPPDRAVLLADALASLDRDLHVVVARGLGLVRARLEACDALRERRVRSDGGDEGIASGIDDDGRLLVRRDDGVLTRWSAGEVHLV